MTNFSDKQKETLVVYASLEAQGILKIGSDYLELDTSSLGGSIAALTFTKAKKNIVEVALDFTPDSKLHEMMLQEGHNLAQILSGSEPMIRELTDPLVTYVNSVQRVYECILRTYEEDGFIQSGITIVNPLDVIRKCFSDRADAERFYEVEMGAVRANNLITYVKGSLMLGKTAIDVTKAENDALLKVYKVAKTVRSGWINMAFGK